MHQGRPQLRVGGTGGSCPRRWVAPGDGQFDDPRVRGVLASINDRVALAVFSGGDLGCIDGCVFCCARLSCGADERAAIGPGMSVEPKTAGDAEVVLLRGLGSRLFGGGVPLGGLVHRVVTDPYVTQSVAVKTDSLRSAGTELQSVLAQVPVHEGWPEITAVLRVGHEEHLLAAKAVEHRLDELGGNRALLLKV